MTPFCLFLMHAPKVNSADSLMVPIVSLWFQQSNTWNRQFHHHYIINANSHGIILFHDCVHFYFVFYSFFGTGGNFALAEAISCFYINTHDVPSL